MDFKVAGSRRGVSALQLDIKQPGLELQVGLFVFTRCVHGSGHGALHGAGHWLLCIRT